MRRFLEEEVWRGGRSAGPVLVRTLLRIPSVLFGAAAAARNLAYDRGAFPSHHAPIPVLSVGGIEVGGVGKTPLCLELARLALEAGRKPAIITRGYGRRTELSGSGAVRVDPGTSASDWRRFGDEPVLMAERLPACPVWISARRIDGARAAAAAGADLAILDDGFQHRSLARDLDVLCLDPAFPLGNGLTLPAGPLREGPGPALRRADWIVLSDGGPAECAATAGALRPRVGADARIVSWQGKTALDAAVGAQPVPGEPAVLVAGIARPGRLEPALRALGHPAAARCLFPDHYPYSRADVETALALRPDRSTLMVTTDKDWIRLRGLAGGGEARWAILRRRIVWNEPEAEASWKDALSRLTGR